MIKAMSGAILTTLFTPILVLADETPVLPPWAQWGILGAVILAMITKQLVPGWLYQDKLAELKLLKEENTRLVQLALDTQKATLPAMEASTSAVDKAMEEIRALRSERAERERRQ
jgi:hypothetical protein